MQFVSRELWIFLAYFLIKKTHLNFMWEKFTCYSYVNFMSNEYDNFFSSAKKFRIKYVISSTDETNKRKTSGVPRCLCQMIIWFFSLKTANHFCLENVFFFFYFATRVFRITRKNSGEKMNLSLFQLRCYFQFFCAFYRLCYETLKIFLKNYHLQ